MLMHHILEQLALLVVDSDTLLDIGHIEYLLCGHAPAAHEQLLHKLIVADSEVAETSETCSGIHEESYEDPACRVKNFVHGEIAAVHLVNSLHEVVELREALSSAVILIYYSRAARGYAALALVFTRKLLTLKFAGMVVEPQPAAFNERYVCEDIVLRDRNEPVLNIFRVLESESVDDACLIQQRATGESVEIGAGYKIHIGIPLFI